MHESRFEDNPFKDEADPSLPSEERIPSPFDATLPPRIGNGETEAEDSEKRLPGPSEKKEWTFSDEQKWFEGSLSPQARDVLKAAAKHHPIEHFAYERDDGKVLLLTIVGETHVQSTKALKSATALFPFYPLKGLERGRSESIIGKGTNFLLKPVMMVLSNPIFGSMISAAEREHRRNSSTTSLFYLEKGHIATKREDAARAFYSLFPLSIYTAGTGTLLGWFHASSTIASSLTATGFALFFTFLGGNLISGIASVAKRARPESNILSVLSAPADGLLHNRNKFFVENIETTLEQTSHERLLALMGAGHVGGVIEELRRNKKFTYIRETPYSQPYPYGNPFA